MIRLVLFSLMIASYSGAKDLLTKVFSNYSNAGTIHLIYVTKQQGFNMADTTDYYKSKSNYFYNGSNHTILSNKKYYIIVDHAMQKIVIKNNNRSKIEGNLSLRGINDLSQDFKDCTVELASTNEVLKFKVLTKNKAIPIVFYEVDKANNKILKAEYINKMYTVGKTTVNYLKNDINKKIDESVFDEETILFKKKGKWIINNKKYLHYSIVDLCN